MGLGQGYCQRVSSLCSLYNGKVADQRSVNLGGWLVTERKLTPFDSPCRADNTAFIVPALYERYQNSTPKAIDEYTLSQA
jgi:hypothetical protein